MTTNTTITSRIVYTVDHMAKAKGIKARHELDTLVGVATRALATGNTELEAIEAARKHADRILHSNCAIEEILAAAHLLQPQALSMPTA